MFDSSTIYELSLRNQPTDSFRLKPPPPPLLISFPPAGSEIADCRHVFQNPVESFVRVLSCNVFVIPRNQQIKHLEL